MLKHLKNSPFIDIDNAHLKSCKYPILEVFISTFLGELDRLVKKGIRRHYMGVERNQPFLKWESELLTTHVTPGGTNVWLVFPYAEALLELCSFHKGDKVVILPVYLSHNPNRV